MTENKKMFLLYINISTTAYKHQYLIRKYNWKSRENFIELSVDSAFSVLVIGSKTKTRNWRKVFYIKFFGKLDFLNFKKT